MPENTEARKRRQKRSAVIGVAAFALLQAAVAVCFGALRQIPDLPGWLSTVFLVLAVLPLALIVPALISLKERFQEIERGESYEASQY